jgi:hypothetical protein
MVQSASILGTNLIMKRAVHSTERDSAQREALRRRVKRFYHRFNKADWKNCYALIDPQLTRQGKVTLDTYCELMQAFKTVYGSINLWFTRVSPHLDAAPKQRDKRPFAYVYVIWQDDAHGFHMFRERWVKAHGQWFTRVVGLIPNTQELDSRRD